MLEKLTVHSVLEENDRTMQRLEIDRGAACQMLTSMLDVNSFSALHFQVPNTFECCDWLAQTRGALLR
jgi:hypothetical protein